MDRSLREKTGLEASADGPRKSDEGQDETKSLHSSDILSNREPGGSWKWMVLVASFFNTFILDGIGSAFGLLYPYVSDKFQSTAFLSSFAGSLFLSYMIMGTLAAWFADRFGYRLVSMTGGVLCCLSFVAAAFCNNIYAFIITFGLLAGCSTGLVYLPSVVVVNKYFTKKRGLANGIVSSGAGAGLVVLAPIIDFLLWKYSLDGAVLILGAITLNMTMFSCLFFPIRSSASGVDVDALSQECTHFNTESESVSYYALKDESSEKQLTETTGWETVTLDSQFKEVHKEGSSDSFLSSRLKSKQPNPIVTIHRNGIQQSHDKAIHSNAPIKIAKKDALHVILDPPWGSEHRLSTRKTAAPPDLKVHRSADNVAHLLHFRPDAAGANLIGSPLHYGSHLYLTGSLSAIQHVQNRYLQKSQKSSLNNLSSRQHSFLANDSHGAKESYSHLCTDSAVFPLPSGEGGHVTEKDSHPLRVNQPELADDERTSVSLDSQQTMESSTLKDLLRKPAFVAFFCGACLIQIGFPVVSTFLADYAIAQNVTSTQSAMVMSIFGSFSIIGRLLGGALASFGFHPLRLHNVMILMGAISCFFCPLYTSFWPLCFFAAAFGLFMGFFPPLQPLIIVEYFGLATLGSAFGFLSMMKGLATILGPPLGGWVYDSCQDYSMSIVFAGSAILLSSVVHQTMVCLKN